MKKHPTPAPASGVPPSGGPSPVVSLQWRRTAGAEYRFYLVAIRADGTEAKVTTPDGHVVTV